MRYDDAAMLPETLDGITLRLLRLFETVYRTGNVSQAAHRLGVSQPSVSLSLNRLRDYFNDPLFIRISARMEPTPRAEALVQAVRSILLIADDEFAAQAPFDPEASERSFTLHMTDLGETILVPALVNELSRKAPRVKIRVRSIAEDSQAMLANGTADLMLGYIAREGEDLRQRKLFDEVFVCIARLGHPRIQGAISLEQFKSEAHINVTIQGTGHLQLERDFDRLRVEGAAVLDLPGFLAIGEAVLQTDLIATVPSRLGRLFATRGGVQVFSLPFESPAFQVRQYWHSRYHNDPGNRWLRNEIVDLFHDGAERPLS